MRALVAIDLAALMVFDHRGGVKIKTGLFGLIHRLVKDEFSDLELEFGILAAGKDSYAKRYSPFTEKDAVTLWPMECDRSIEAVKKHTRRDVDIETCEMDEKGGAVFDEKALNMLENSHNLPRRQMIIVSKADSSVKTNAEKLGLPVIICHDDGEIADDQVNAFIQAALKKPIQMVFVDADKSTLRLGESIVRGKTITSPYMKKAVGEIKAKCPNARVKMLTARPSAKMRILDLQAELDALGKQFDDQVSEVCQKLDRLLAAKDKDQKQIEALTATEEQLRMQWEDTIASYQQAAANILREDEESFTSIPNIVKTFKDETGIDIEVDEQSYTGNRIPKGEAMAAQIEHKSETVAVLIDDCSKERESATKEGFHAISVREENTVHTENARAQLREFFNKVRSFFVIPDPRPESPRLSPFAFTAHLGTVVTSVPMATEHKTVHQSAQEPLALRVIAANGEMPTEHDKEKESKKLPVTKLTAFTAPCKAFPSAPRNGFSSV